MSRLDDMKQGAKEGFHQSTDADVKASKTSSGAWFLAFAVAAAVGIALTVAGVTVVGGGVGVLALILFVVAIWKHGSAGGDTASMGYGVSQGTD
jgi:hypothetical protein